MTFRPRALMAGIALCFAAPLFAANAVLLPLSRVDGGDEAAEVIRPLLEKRLTEKGWNLAPAAEVETFLEEHRVRYLESIEASLREQLLTQFDARVIVHGSILAYRDGSDSLVALSVRMVDGEGGVIWGDVFSLSASGSESILGLGRPGDVASLAREVASRVMSRLPGPGDRGSVRPGSAARFGAPRTYRSADHQRGETLRICVLPFISREAMAGRIVGELLTVRLESSGEFEVIEPAELRSAMRLEGIRSIAAMTSEEMARVGQHLGTALFLRGNIHSFRDGMSGRSEVQLDMNLSDVQAGTILWAVAHQRRGLDYAGLLQRGTVDNVIELADRVISEAIEAYGRAPLRETKQER